MKHWLKIDRSGIYIMETVKEGSATGAVIPHTLTEAQFQEIQDADKDEDLTQPYQAGEADGKPVPWVVQIMDAWNLDLKYAWEFKEVEIPDHLLPY